MKNPRMRRREWIAAVIGLGLGVETSGDEPRALDDDERDRGEVEGRAKKVGLDAFRVTRTTHYLGLGNAPAKFRERALQICEGLARDYLEHFRKNGFAVERPARRLTVVMLADPRSFAAFVGEEPGRAVAGQFDLETNRLIIFDNRAGDLADLARAERANMVALVHEATHQLTYNTGLLRRAGDVPRCVSEGLAMYAEVRRPTGRSLPGQPNPRRVEALALARKQGVAWTPAVKLIVGDALLEGEAGEEAQQGAYAQSWLLVYHLMKAPERIDGFRSFLKAIWRRDEPESRLDDARAHLGDLDRLDADLRRQADRLLNGRGS